MTDPKDYNGWRCPGCGKLTVALVDGVGGAIPIEEHAKDATQEVKCTYCRARWTETLVYTGYKDFEAGDEDDEPTLERGDNETYDRGG